MAKLNITASECGNVFTISCSNVAPKLTITVAGESSTFAVDQICTRLQITDVREFDSESGHQSKYESACEDDAFFCEEFVSLLKQKPDKVKIEKIFDKPNLLKLRLKCSLVNIYGVTHNTGVYITDDLDIEWSVLPVNIVAIKRTVSTST